MAEFWHPTGHEPAAPGLAGATITVINVWPPLALRPAFRRVNHRHLSSEATKVKAPDTARPLWRTLASRLARWRSAKYADPGIRRWKGACLQLPGDQGRRPSWVPSYPL